MRIKRYLDLLNEPKTVLPIVSKNTAENIIYSFLKENNNLPYNTFYKSIMLLNSLTATQSIIIYSLKGHYKDYKFNKITIPFSYIKSLFITYNDYIFNPFNKPKSPFKLIFKGIKGVCASIFTFKRTNKDIIKDLSLIHI